jgi:hypothetical protein
MQGEGPTHPSCMTQNEYAYECNTGCGLLADHKLCTGVIDNAEQIVLFQLAIHVFNLLFMRLLVRSKKAMLVEEGGKKMAGLIIRR